MSFDHAFDASVLRAMLRLARRRQPAQDSELRLRVGRTAREVRASLRRLRSQGLVEIRVEAAPRLTLTGLAVAVALLPPRPRMAERRASPTSRASRAA
jgi:predicted transcriptional regulator